MALSKHTIVLFQVTYFFTLLSLFNIHKCNPLNLKSFPAHINEGNHNSMVAKPQECMNKSAERKKGENGAVAGCGREGGLEGGVKQN